LFHLFSFISLVLFWPSLWPFLAQCLLTPPSWQRNANLVEEELIIFNRVHFAEANVAIASCSCTLTASIRLNSCLALALLPPAFLHCPVCWRKPGVLDRSCMAFPHLVFHFSSFHSIALMDWNCSSAFPSCRTARPFGDCAHSNLSSAPLRSSIQLLSNRLMCSLCACEGKVQLLQCRRTFPCHAMRRQTNPGKPIHLLIHPSKAKRTSSSLRK